MMHLTSAVRHNAQWLRRRWQRRLHGSRAIVLAYHRVAQLDRDPLRLCVSPTHFHEHLTVLRGYRPLRLDALPAALEADAGMAERVCITIDDGYADSLSVAKPLLERHDTPATVFVAAGQLDADHEFWWDELDRLLLAPRSHPDVPLPFPIPGARRDADPSGGDRLTLFHEVHRRLYDADPDERAMLLDALRAWAGVGTELRSSHATLSRPGVVRLDAGPLVEIGAHSMTHPRLDRVSHARQEAEIVESKRMLEELLGRPVTSFAYPHGAYSTRTLALVKTAGFARACTIAARPTSRATPVLEIPRFLVRDMDGDGLARRLHDWFGRSSRGSSLGRH